MTFRIVIEHAHICNGLGDPERVTRKSRILDDWCCGVGRDPKEIGRSTRVDDHSQVRNADGYVENGITHLLLGFSGPDCNLRSLREPIGRRYRDRGRHPGAAS